MALSWKPELHGKIYCSPACGGNCKLSEYRSALKKARGLAKRLGKGWKPNVWENLGWYFEVKNSTGLISVIQSSKNDWNATWDGQYSAYGKTPEEAVVRLIGFLKAAASRLNKAVKSAESNIG